MMVQGTGCVPFFIIVRQMYGGSWIKRTWLRGKSFAKYLNLRKHINKLEDLSRWE